MGSIDPNVFATSPTLEELSSTISSRAYQITELLKHAGLPHPSLGESSYADFAEESDTPVQNDLRKARDDLISSAKDLIRLAMGPIDQILTLAWSASDSANLDLITRFEIPQHVPSGSAIPLKELAIAVGLPEGILARSVRFAIGNGVFQELAPGLIAHSAASAALARNGHLRNICHFATEFVGSIQTKIPETLKLQQKSPETAPKTAFNVAYATEKNLFDHFHHDTELNKKYHEYLDGRVNTPLWSIERLQKAWDWAALGSGTVIDVGGSSGHTCRFLAPICPDVTFIVQDANEDAMTMGRKQVAADPKLSGRITFETHDFFKPQTITADVYIFRHILHDWSDADSIRILTSLVPALKDGARILISEGIVPEPPAKRTNTHASKMIRVEDMTMLAAHDAIERTVSDFISLFKQSSEKYHFVGETSGSKDGAFQSLLEFVYKA